MNAQAPADGGVVLRTTSEADLRQIRLPQVQAVVWTPPTLPPWFEELGAAVRDGSFHFRRACLGNADAAQIDAWLEESLPTARVSPDVREAAKQDVLALVERQRALTGASRFMVRALTDEPSRHCGFHVDTVPPDAPRWGVLRVYNGAGTDYVDPSNVVSMRAFYVYMSRRERLVRSVSNAAAAGDRPAHERLSDDLARLDAECAFLRDRRLTCTAPAGSVIAFKHLDVSLHWSDHAVRLAWIHCSPMDGERRFVVNVTARAPWGRRSPAPGPGAIVP
jgi:Protein of unknown function (DUF1826)